MKRLLLIPILLLFIQSFGQRKFNHDHDTLRFRDFTGSIVKAMLDSPGYFHIYKYDVGSTADSAADIDRTTGKFYKHRITGAGSTAANFANTNLTADGNRSHLFYNSGTSSYYNLFIDSINQYRITTKKGAGATRIYNSLTMSGASSVLSVQSLVGSTSVFVNSDSVRLLAQGTLTGSANWFGSDTAGLKIHLNDSANNLIIRGVKTITDTTGVEFLVRIKSTGAVRKIDPMVLVGGFITASSTNTLTNKSISGSTNTLTNIGNSSLTNSTISGVALGGNLFSLTPGNGITGSVFNGSSNLTWRIDSLNYATLKTVQKKIDSIAALIISLTAQKILDSLNSLSGLNIQNLAGTPSSFGQSGPDGLTRILTDATESTSNIILEVADQNIVTVNSTGVVVTGNISATNLTSGTYTPTLTNTTNITSSTANNCTYTLVGNQVTVYGSADVTTTLAVASVILISLPIVSDITQRTDLNGLANAQTAIATNGIVRGEATADSAELDFIGLSVGGSGRIYFSFQYTKQ